MRLGSGHVMRCAALARALRRTGARAVFLGVEGHGSLLGWLRDDGFEAVALPSPPPQPGEESPPWSIDAAADARRTRSALTALDPAPDWIVVDHYGLDAVWERAVRTSGTRLLAIDDLADRPHDADVLVDPNLQARPDRYRALVPPRCKVLLGPRYALMRPEFAASPVHQERARRPLRRVLACMGGTDPLDALGTVLDAWSLLPAPRPALDIAVGAASPNLDALRAHCAGLADVELHVQTAEMAALMARADLLIGSAGSISWERCSLALPALMGTTADNQRSNLALLARARTGIALGDWAAVDADMLAQWVQRLARRPGLVARMAARAGRLVDPRGAERVAVHMAADRIALRPAIEDDAELAWTWRNAPATRRHFHDPRPVALTEHRAWWTRSRADPKRELMLAEIGEVPVGVLRFDHAADTATVSIYLDPELVGLGLGACVLRAGQRRIAAQHPGYTLHAEILPANLASRSSFEAAGFVPRGDRWIWGSER